MDRPTPLRRIVAVQWSDVVEILAHADRTGLPAASASRTSTELGRRTVRDPTRTTVPGTPQASELSHDARLTTSHAVQLPGASPKCRLGGRLFDGRLGHRARLYPQLRSQRDAATRLRAQHLEAGRDLPVAGDGDEVDAVEHFRVTEVGHHPAREIDSCLGVGLERLDHRVGHGQFGNVY